MDKIQGSSLNNMNSKDQDKCPCPYSFVSIVSFHSVICRWKLKFSLFAGPHLAVLDYFLKKKKMKFWVFRQVIGINFWNPKEKQKNKKK